MSVFLCNGIQTKEGMRKLAGRAPVASSRGTDRGKLFEFNLVALDGYFDGPKRDISWHNVDAEFNEFAADMLNAVDTYCSDA